MTIPPKFIDGCQGDMVEARRRWDITRSWREEFDVDSILSKPHPKFDIIKKHWPHFFLPAAKNGDPVYVEVRCLLVVWGCVFRCVWGGGLVDWLVVRSFVCLCGCLVVC
jgi:hypothetical protein